MKKFFIIAGALVALVIPSVASAGLQRGRQPPTATFTVSHGRVRQFER